MKTAKALVAGIALVVTALTAALADNALDTSEAAALVIALVEAVVGVWVVWRVPNKPTA